MDETKTKTKTIHPAFTVDVETMNADMPSITRLLNRKKVEAKSPPKSKSSSEQIHEVESNAPVIAQPPQFPGPPAPSIPGTPGEITSAEDATVVQQPIRLESPDSSSVLIATPPASEPAPLVLEPPLTSNPETPVLVPKKAERKKQELKLLIWDQATLQKGSDPLGKGILLLLQKGITSALFLKISPPRPGSSLPDFISSAAVQPQDKFSLWTGMRWDPLVSPEAWNQLLKAGYVEFPPPGTYTNLQSVRNVARAAFGASGDDWLTLIRVGSPTTCRGIMGLISPKSMAVVLPQVLPIIQAEPPVPAKTS